MYKKNKNKKLKKSRSNHIIRRVSIQNINECSKLVFVWKLNIGVVCINKQICLYLIGQ